MLALCPEALKEEEASASYTAPTPTPTPYVPQSEDYAGAGAVVPPNDDALPGGHDTCPSPRTTPARAPSSRQTTTPFQAGTSC